MDPIGDLRQNFYPYSEPQKVSRNAPPPPTLLNEHHGLILIEKLSLPVVNTQDNQFLSLPRQNSFSSQIIFPMNNCHCH